MPSVHKKNTASLNGIKLSLDSPAISATMREKIKSGEYERGESLEIPKLLQKGEVVLEIGAGIGYISSYTWKTGLCEKIVVVEANPDLIPIIEQTHSENNIPATVIQGCLNDSEGECSFYTRNDFWASSLSPNPHFKEEKKIPMIHFQNLLDELQPTTIICDIEGGEADIFANVSLKGVRKIFLEIHQRMIGRAGIKQLFDHLSAQGFHYDQWHSSRAQVLFSHIDLERTLYARTKLVFRFSNNANS